MRRSGGGKNGVVAGRCRVGWLLALVAVLLQLAAPAMHPPRLVAASIEAELSDLFARHALCISAGADQPAGEAPADRGPQPADDHFAGCCPWHANQAQAIPTPSAIASVAFSDDEAAFAVPEAVIVAACLPGTVRARAPPISA